MSVPTTSMSWQHREPVYRQYLAEMSDESLLRLARCLWFEALQRIEGFSTEDRAMLGLSRAEAEKRGVVGTFDALEIDMRDELRMRGLLPEQRATMQPRV